MKKIFSDIIFLFFFIVSLTCLAQNDSIKFDKLESNLKHLAYDNPDSGLIIANAAFKETYIQKNKKFLSALHKFIGVIYLNKADFTNDLFHQKQALKFAEEAKDKKLTAMATGNLGILYDAIGDYAKALEYQSKALALFESANYARGIANTNTNIGIVYGRINKQELSNTYFEKAILKYTELNDTQNLANNYNNLAQNLLSLKKYTEAEAVINKLIKLVKPDNYFLQSHIYSNLGKIRENQGKYDEALSYHEQSMAFKKIINNVRGIGTQANSIGQIYTIKKNYKVAEEYFRFADSIFVATSDTFKLSDNYYAYYSLLKEKGDYKSALKYHEFFHEFYAYQLNSEQYEKIFNLKEGFGLHEQEKKLKTESDIEKKKMEVIATAERKSKNTIIVSIVIGLVLVSIFLIIVFNRFKVTKKQNRIIEEQKRVVEHQKELVEEQQKEVMDSIIYARRIQRALITSDTYIKKYLTDCFILYHPKDIVSGDFYWALNHKNKFYLITADCTGHGVPGAFMSLLNISILNEVMIEKNITRVDLILNEVRKDIIKALNPEDSTEECKDGMDCILTCYDFETLELTYTAANNSFYIYRDGALIDCKADKMPVGKAPQDEQSFSLNTFQLQKGDIVYTLTDGLPDQFGGPKGKKYKYKQLEDILLSNAQLPMEEQKSGLEKSFFEWKGNHEQVDDVLLIGCRI